MARGKPVTKEIRQTLIEAVNAAIEVKLDDTSVDVAQRRANAQPLYRAIEYVEGLAVETDEEPEDKEETPSVAGRGGRSRRGLPTAVAS